MSIIEVIKFRRFNFDFSSNTTSSSTSGFLFEKPLIPLISACHSVENSFEKTHDYTNIESLNQYENGSINIQRTLSSSSTTSASTCSPTTNPYPSIPNVSPIYSQDHRTTKRSRSPSTTDEETNKRVCLTTNIRPNVKNDLRNIETLIERVPDKTINNELTLIPTTIDPNYFYLFYMAQFHNHQKTPLLHPYLLQRYLLNSQQYFQNDYYYSSITNTK